MAGPKLSARHRKTLRAVFARPTRAGVSFRRVCALLEALGGEVSHNRSGSRVRFVLGNRKATFHAPHPGDEMKKYAVEDVRDFLREAGVRPEQH